MNNEKKKNIEDDMIDNNGVGAAVIKWNVITYNNQNIIKI